jgi:DNA-binding CsgD family transcriptional regulator
MKILAFPNRPEEWPRPKADLAREISAKLAPKSTDGVRIFASEFKSGSRTYQCRALPVAESSGKRQKSSRATTLLLLERIEPSSVRAFGAWDKFGLSHRERQLVALLIKGMTTKEMAQSLQLSPNTVKSFVRMIMAKMGVSNRAGIVGQLVEHSRS